jgi:hypothetical protein
MRPHVARIVPATALDEAVLMNALLDTGGIVVSVARFWLSILIAAGPPVGMTV